MSGGGEPKATVVEGERTNESTSGAKPRSFGRLRKRLHGTEPKGGAGETVAPTATTVTSGRRATPDKDKEVVAKCRGWEPWSQETVHEFYTALKQYGKDFDAIQKHIAQKSKFGLKNYDQVRNFYYNTWGKISSRVDLSDINAPKEAKELFVLVNYGEWQQRANSIKIHGKLAANFTELVRKGRTKFTVSSSRSRRQRRYRVIIKTPLCPSLKKFLPKAGEVKSTGIQVPKAVTVECCPKTYGDKGYVLDCFKNPYVRIMVPIEMCVERLIAYLRNRWILEDVYKRKTLLKEDISAMLPEITLHPTPENPLQLFSMRTTAASNANEASKCFGLETCFPVNKEPPEEPVTSKPADDTGEAMDCAKTNESAPPSGSTETQAEGKHSSSKKAVDETKETLTLDPSPFAKGLTRHNCRYLKFYHLFLMCGRKKKICFTYRVRPSKESGYNDVPPVWKCFVNLVKTGIGDQIRKKMNTPQAEAPSPRSATGESPLSDEPRACRAAGGAASNAASRATGGGHSGTTARASSSSSHHNVRPMSPLKNQPARAKRSKHGALTRFSSPRNLFCLKIKKSKENSVADRMTPDFTGELECKAFAMQYQQLRNKQRPRRGRSVAIRNVTEFRSSPAPIVSQQRVLIRPQSVTMTPRPKPLAQACNVRRPPAPLATRIVAGPAVFPTVAAVEPMQTEPTPSTSFLYCSEPNAGIYQMLLSDQRQQPINAVQNAPASMVGSSTMLTQTQVFQPTPPSLYQPTKTHVEGFYDVSMDSSTSSLFGSSLLSAPCNMDTSDVNDQTHFLATPTKATALDPLASTDLSNLLLQNVANLNVS